uniref:Uncharacterized protein n=1 Tax=Brassica oleracea var. oleracea TaxID=109376 RepID=A0A0D3CYK9_BRAOL
MDAARASPCGSPCNGLRSRVLQPTCKFRSGQGSNPGTDTPAGAPIPLDQSNLKSGSGEDEIWEDCRRLEVQDKGKSKDEEEILIIIIIIIIVIIVIIV